MQATHPNGITAAYQSGDNSQVKPYRPRSSTLGLKILKLAAYRFFSDSVFTMGTQSDESRRCLAHLGPWAVAGQMN